MVTVLFFASRSMTLFCAPRDRNSVVVLAMSLKQCFVPRTLNLGFAFTKRRTSSVLAAEYRRSLPYSRFPAQLANLCSSAESGMRETHRPAAAKEAGFINVRLLT